MHKNMGTVSYFLFFEINHEIEMNFKYAYETKIEHIKVKIIKNNKHIGC